MAGSHYDREGIPEVMTSLRTTATLIIVWEDWFDDANTRRDVARALRTVMCGRESIHPADIRTTHQNVQVVRDGRSSEVSRAIVIWDRVGGGLGLSKAVADNLGRYTQALLEIARQPGQRSEQERLLREDTAAALHRWATSMAPHTLGPENTPVITGYAGTTFRSQLEARWAAYFDQRGIAWQYEPVPAQRLDSRLPARVGRRRGLRRGQARERVPHGCGPAGAERRMYGRHTHPGPGAAPRLAIPGRRMDPGDLAA